MDQIRPSIHDEWSPLTAALVYPAAETGMHCLGPGREETVGLHTVLRDHGVRLLVADVPPYKHDRFFARDTVFTVRDRVFRSLAANGWRRAEQAPVEQALRDAGIASDEAPKDGGDVLVMGDTVLVGYAPWKEDPSETVECTDPSGTEEAMKAAIEAIGLKVLLLCHHGMHLDTCVAPQPDGSFLWHEDFFTPGSAYDLTHAFGRSAFTHVPSRPLLPSLNFQWLDPDTVLVPAASLAMLELARRRQDVWYVLSEGIRSGGGPRCTVAPLARE